MLPRAPGIPGTDRPVGAVWAPVPHRHSGHDRFHRLPPSRHRQQRHPTRWRCPRRGPDPQGMRRYPAGSARPANWHWRAKKRRGCGNISASASTFFFRQSTATMYDIASGSYSPVTQITRPGCWINMIPASGLLLIPEGSSGCTCNYPIQTSMAFAPQD